MARFLRGSSPLARHAAVLCVSLAALAVPVGGGVIDIGASSESTRLRTLADLPGAVNDCVVGAAPDACPGLRLGWQPAVDPAVAQAAAASPETAQTVAAVEQPAPETEAPAIDWPTMEVRPGDTLFGLAIWFGISPWDLAAFNGLDMDGLIVIGQALAIPVPPEEFSVPPEPVPLYVSGLEEEVAEPPPASALVAVPAPTPAPTPPPTPFSGTQNDVINAICSLPWPCDQMVRVAYCESGLNPNAYNPAGYYGLFQINYMFDGWNDPWTNSRVAYEQKYLPAAARGDALSPWPLCRYA